MFEVCLFVVVLIFTGVITRVLTHFLHDRKQYNKNTLTGYLRRKTKREIHHIHFGFVLVFVGLIFTLLEGLSLFSIVLFSIGLSFIADQIFPLLNVCDYFYWQGVLCSILNHLIILLVVCFIWYFAHLRWFL